MLTVGLPVFKQNHILPVALEGLSRQITSHAWELIVCSEEEISHIVLDYEERLKKAGCQRIVIDKIEEWIPLSQKWRRIAKLMHNASLGLMLQAADCYSHKKRIEQSAEAMLKGFDWYHEKQGYFYDIPSNKLAVYSKSNGFTHLNMCMAADHARSLPDVNVKKHVDFWLLSTISEPRKIYNETDNCGGVDFNGCNTISLRRGSMIQLCLPPFSRTTKKIEDVIPSQIITFAKLALKNI